MKAITIKMESELLKEIDSTLSRNLYSTRTEFIRDAIRKRLSELEKKELLREITKMHGSSKKKTTDEELHKLREKLAREL